VGDGNEDEGVAGVGHTGEGVVPKEQVSKGR
jgi:hypothetical protein